MKYLGIDYGTKKIGLATSDDGGEVAFPHSVVVNNTDASASIVSFAHENNISHIVIGHSKNHNGEDNPIMKHVKAFQTELTALGFMVSLEPEFLTTFQAKRMSGDSVADASAAALILQSFLDGRVA